jgi:hypothetical protein
VWNEAFNFEVPGHGLHSSVTSGVNLVCFVMRKGEVFIIIVNCYYYYHHCYYLFILIILIIIVVICYCYYY